ncbi:MAG: succinylglutamate desuccinylase/aspartoacylase family protein [Rhodospirillaceae bacterium]|nr:succinylglutamate desuccinylase/aspartoacylase family protein [Rhodospirillaceae bacterium]MBT3556613.1 succinylglutamate desuccinylase/aspartoacylase family protein [Rhodospirillales bacterium]MBT4627366.1 succinylglutamate desuccinylase/aspartoacylase family protein [Rhodospirillales bacterium]MBT6110818.1 succinylglutamate desuccinylase/aspartoacylase family protein [Rhodospirillales bacterium]
MSRTTETITLPTYSPGTTRELKVWRWGTPGARPKVYFQAALHADEWPGLMASHHLAPKLDQADAEGRIKGEIIMLPYANPIGMAQVVNGQMLGRFNFSSAHGNFNRDWPDLRDAVAARVTGKLGTDPDANAVIMREALLACVADLPDTSETEAHTKAVLGLSIDADYMFDLHCDLEATLHLYAHQEHTSIVMELARYLSVPVVMVDTGLAGGPFDETHANPWMNVRDQLGLDESALPAACFATTVELRGQTDVSDELGAQDAAGLFNFLVHRGVLSGDAPTMPDALCEPTPLGGVDSLKSPIAGLIAWKKKLGERVEKGEVIAEIIDIAEDDPAQARTPVLARTRGLLFSMDVDRMTRAGDTVGKIAGAKTLEHRDGDSLLSN